MEISMLPIMLTRVFPNGEEQGKMLCDVERIKSAYAVKGGENDGRGCLLLSYEISNSPYVYVKESLDEVYAAIKTSLKETGYRKDASNLPSLKPEKKGPS